MVNDQGIWDRGYNPSSLFCLFTGHASLSLQMCYGRVASPNNQNNLLVAQCAINGKKFFETLVKGKLNETKSLILYEHSESKTM